MGPKAKALEEETGAGRRCHYPPLRGLGPCCEMLPGELGGVRGGGGGKLNWDSPCLRV